MNSSVRLLQVSSLPLAVVRRVARRDELATVVPMACGLVWGTLRAHNVPGTGRHVALYLDDQIRLEVGVLLERPFPGAGEVVPSWTPSGLAATALHLGPYGRLHETHDVIHRYCDRQGLVRLGPCWEIYGHWQDAWNLDPSRIETEVFYALGADDAVS